MTPPDKSTTKTDFWQQHILQWRAAQQTQVSYWREYNLNFHQFNYWLRKEEPVKARKKKITTSSTSSSFVPVVKHQSASSGLSLSLPSGITLQGIDPGNLATVKQLLGLLS